MRKSVSEKKEEGDRAEWLELKGLCPALLHQEGWQAPCWVDLSNEFDTEENLSK